MVAVAVGVAVGVGGGVPVTVAVGVEVGVGDPGSFTRMTLLVPVIEGFTVSVAVIVWGPQEKRVASKDPVPSVNMLSAGKFAGRLLVKCTVPG